MHALPSQPNSVGDAGRATVPRTGWAMSLALIGAVGAVAIVVLVVVGEILIDRERTVDRAITEIGNLADALAADTDQTLSIMDRALATFVAAVDPATMAQPEERRRTAALLRDRADLMASVRVLFLIDEDGRLIASSGPSGHQAGADLSGRPAFKVHRGDPGLGTHIEPAELARLGDADRWHLSFSRRLNHADGRFAGIVVAIVLLDEFMKFQVALNIGARGAVGLFSDDGILIARRPFVPEFVGKSYMKAPLFAVHFPKTPHGSYRSEFVTDQVVRLSAYRTIPDKGVVVYIGFAEDDVLAPWRERTAIIAIIGGALIGVIIAFALAIRRRCI